MAIINSVVMGAARRKVGEVTLSVQHGRTIARKYQPAVFNPQTPAQMANRYKMKNVMMVFQAFPELIRKGWNGRGQYQSAYNAFISAWKQSMPDVPYSSLSDLRDDGYFDTLTISPYNLPVPTWQRGGGSWAFEFSGAGEPPLYAGDIIYVGYHYPDGSTYLQNYTVTSTDVSNAEAAFPVLNTTFDFVGCVIYRPSTNRSSGYPINGYMT